MDIEDIKQRISFFFSNLSANFSFFFDRVNVKLTFNNGSERDLLGILPVFGYVGLAEKNWNSYREKIIVE